MARIKLPLVAGLLSVFVMLASSVSLCSAKTQKIQGYVLDSACAFTKNVKKPVSPACAVACARAGSPLVILADDGVIYWPISDVTPAKGQNARLMRFAGKAVRVSGTVYERGGSHAIVIKKITEAELNR